MVDPVYQVELSLLILVVGSLVSLAVSKQPRLCGWMSIAFVGAAAVSTWLAAATAFTGGPYERTVLALPQLGASLTLRVDPLSAIFLAIVALVALASTLYSVRYMEHYARDKVGTFYPATSAVHGEHDRSSRLGGFALLPRLLGVDDADVLLPGDI